MNNPSNTNRRILGLPRQVWGGISMAAGVACLAGNHSIVRIVSDEVGAFETSALRFMWALPLMLPWILKGKGEVLRTKRHGLHFVSASLTAITTALLFLGLAHLPVALATTLNFTAPLFTTIMAVVLLKERVELARWAATVVGFLGVVVILRPGLVVFDPATLLPICSAAVLTLWYFTLKRRRSGPRSCCFCWHCRSGKPPVSRLFGCRSPWRLWAQPPSSSWPGLSSWRMPR